MLSPLIAFFVWEGGVIFRESVTEKRLFKMDCLFCKIINGEIPSAKVYEDELVYAFNASIAAALVKSYSGVPALFKIIICPP